MADTSDELRPRLYGDAAKKMRTWEREIWERYQVKVSPERMLNLIVENLEFLDIEQTIRIGFKSLPPEPGEPRRKEKPRVIIRTSKFGSR